MGTSDRISIAIGLSNNNQTIGLSYQSDFSYWTSNIGLSIVYIANGLTNIRLCLLDGDSPPGPAASNLQRLSSSLSSLQHSFCLSRPSCWRLRASPVFLFGGHQVLQVLQGLDFWPAPLSHPAKASAYLQQAGSPSPALSGCWPPLLYKTPLTSNFHYGTSTSICLVASKSINLSRSCFNLFFIINYWQSRARICKRLRSPVLEFLNNLLGPWTEWENRVVVPAAQATQPEESVLWNRFLGSLKNSGSEIDFKESIPGGPVQQTGLL